MPYQTALTVVAPVRAGAAGELERLLAEMGDGVANGSVLDLGSPSGVHFARLVLVGADTDVRGRPLPANLLYIADLDVARDEHLRELVRQGAGIDRVFGHCEGYPDRPDDAARLRFLREHAIRTPAVYVNGRGRTVGQVRREEELRLAVNDFLDRRRGELAGRGPEEIRAAVREFVRNDPALAWALEPAERPSVGERIRDGAHLVGVGALVVAALPLALVTAPIYALLLRWHERRDESPHHRADEARVQELAALEDHLAQNPFTAVGHVKPGPFRDLTILVILFLLDYVARHFLKRGDLVGVKTIHFARWVFLDDRRRVLFASNYDGSLENYMDDFIDKLAWGLNLVFSNGIGYPKTRWLIKDGCRDELAFKDYLRLHQVPTRVWHSSYGQLSALNVNANERLRAGLHRKLNGRQEREWVQAL